MKRVINILLVASDERDRIDLSRVLHRQGIVHAMHAVEDMHDAMSVAKESACDFILIDVDMTRETENEILHAVEEDFPTRDAKVFLLTSTLERKRRDELMNRGISGVIVKPLNPEKPKSRDAITLMIDLMNN